MYKLVFNQMTQKIECVNKQEGNLLLSIPFDPNNVDYQKYLEWVNQGNQPTPAEEQQ